MMRGARLRPRPAHHPALSQLFVSCRAPTESDVVDFSRIFGVARFGSFYCVFECFIFRMHDVQFLRKLIVKPLVFQVPAPFEVEQSNYTRLPLARMHLQLVEYLSTQLIAYWLCFALAVPNSWLRRGGKHDG